ncbi:MAG: OprD family outer membrane porin [Candidatus Eremiobacteraeota bacterium]|nr:OprD family outer membrane porin [Candidatus Eremiobacteraeota bacterium]
MRNFLARLLLGASVFVLSATAVVSAQTSATPAPAAAPTSTPAAGNPIKLSGNLRAFYFTRSNAVNCDSIVPTLLPKPSAGTTGIPCNATAFNSGGKIHADYQFGKTPFSLGASYFGAEPFGANGRNPGFNPRIDNSVPGYEISLLGEAYLQYKNKFVTGQVGREVINTPWANASDSRITPVSFQGAWISGNVSPTVTLGAYYMGRFRSRTTSAFYNSTLLTSCNQQTPIAGYFQPSPPAAGSTPLAGADPCANPLARQSSKGFAMFQVTKKFNPTWVANIYQYNVYDVVNITHIDTKYNFLPKAATNPFLAAQYIAESDTGRALAGAIHAHMFGLQYGMSLGHNIDFAAGYNQSPQTVSVAAPGKCAQIPGGVFGGVAGPQVTGYPVGTVYCYGGGIASPYTDSYATDPLFTTQISQGMADVHKPGTGLKAALTFQTNDRRFKAIVSGAQYYYGLPVGIAPGTPGYTSGQIASSQANAVDNRKELNVDVTYFFNKVDPKKTYRGFSLRHRYADRSTFFGAGATATSNPDFKYNRTQLEFTF